MERQVLGQDRHINVARLNNLMGSHPSFSKRTITSHLMLLNIKKKTTRYDVGNAGPSSGQAHICGEVKPVNGISILTAWWLYVYSKRRLLTVEMSF